MGLINISQFQYYNNESLYGNYQFVTLANIISAFKVAYVGEGKIFDLKNVFKKFENENYLFPTSDILKSEVPDFLNSLKLSWQRAILYKTVVSDLSDLRDVYYDILVFFSPSGIESLFKNFPDFKQNKTRIAAYGKTTIKAAENHGFKVQVKAPSDQSPSMTMAIERYVEKVN